MQWRKVNSLQTMDILSIGTKFLHEIYEKDLIESLRKREVSRLKPGAQAWDP